MNTFFFVWLSVSIVFLLFELGHPGLFLYLSFSFGGLFAAVISLFSYSIAFQTISFLGGSILSLALFRLALHRTVEQWDRTNVYALVGKRGVVVETITNTVPGYVRVQSQLWMARSLDGSLLQKGDSIFIEDVRGAHVVVRKDHSLMHED